MNDPFDTAGLRRAVLDAWAASPARFREDANAEEELVDGFALVRVPDGAGTRVVDAPDLRPATTGAPLPGAPATYREHDRLALADAFE